MIDLWPLLATAAQNTAPLFAAGLIVAVLSGPRMKGRVAEWRVRRSLQRLERAGCTVMHDLMLPSPRGTTQIDHLVVGAFGVVVIETKALGGLITGSIRAPLWQQHHGRRKRSIPNPEGALDGAAPAGLSRIGACR